MSVSYLEAAAVRSADCVARALSKDTPSTSIACKLLYDSGSWAVVETSEAGRCLVAKKDLPPRTKVFTERPVVVAYPKDDDEDLITAVSRKLVDMVHWRVDQDGHWKPAGQFAMVCELQSADGAARGTEAWARSLARINVHGAGGSLIDPTHQRRGVLGLLSSMMQHECSPNCVIHISAVTGCRGRSGSRSGNRIGESSSSSSSSSGGGGGDDDDDDDKVCKHEGEKSSSSSDDDDEDDDGSLMSLHTIRRVAAGERLSISYIGAYRPTSLRRTQLLEQHGFVCECTRCTALPECVRAFRCPMCGDGPCSPTSPQPTCRDVYCDACGRTSRLDEEAWARLAAAENCSCADANGPCVASSSSSSSELSSQSCEDCASVLHRFHYRPVLRLQRRLLELTPNARAEALELYLYARERLYSSFIGADDAHPLIANDRENVAIALLAAGEVAKACDSFAEAARRFAAFYNATSPDADRCLRGTQAKTFREYKKTRAAEIR